MSQPTPQQPTQSLDTTPFAQLSTGIARKLIRQEVASATFRGVFLALIAFSFLAAAVSLVFGGLFAAIP